MNKILVIGLLLILALGAIFLVNSSSKKDPAENTAIVEQEINYKAYFAIFTNGTLRDFSSPRYHNQSNDVFISSDNPMVVNVKGRGVTWDYFFKTLPEPMKLTTECLTTGTGQVFCTNETGSLKFFLNGELENELLPKEIKNGDKLLITYGNENEEIQNQLKLLE